jgi:hypothetical protein
MIAERVRSQRAALDYRGVSSSFDRHENQKALMPFQQRQLMNQFTKQKRRMRNHNSFVTLMQNQGDASPPQLLISKSFANPP